MPAAAASSMLARPGCSIRSAEPGQRHKDVERGRLDSPGGRTGRTGIVRDGADLQAAGHRPVLVGRQRHIAGHQPRFLDSQTPPHPRTAAPSLRSPQTRSSTTSPSAASCPKGFFCPEPDCVELVRHAEHLDPVDTPGAVFIRDDAGYLQNWRYRSAKLLLQIIRKRRPEEAALWHDGKLDLSQAGLQGLLRACTALNRQPPARRSIPPSQPRQPAGRPDSSASRKQAARATAATDSWPTPVMQRPAAEFQHVPDPRGQLVASASRRSASRPHRGSARPADRRCSGDVLSSSEPVGSSASSSFGLLISARATATRCRCPPDNSPGR